MEKDEYRAKTVTTVSRHGLIQLFSADLIGNAIRAYGEWAWLETQFVAGLMTNLVESGKAVAPAWYDVGACIGTFSLGMHTLTAGLCSGAGLSAVAIEGYAATAQVLERNISTLVGGKIAIVKDVIGIEGLTLTPVIQVGNVGGASFVDSASVGHGEQARHSCVPLWKIRSAHGPYGLLKLDVEGMEVDVIKTDQQWIADNKPVIYAECNESGKSVELFDLLVWLGYDVYFFSFPAFNPKNFLGVLDDILFNAAHEAALVAVPPRMNVVEELPSRECILRRLESRADLVRALWLTPRFVSRRYRELQLSELYAIVERLGKGESFDAFANRLAPDA